MSTAVAKKPTVSQRLAQVEAEAARVQAANESLATVNDNLRENLTQAQAMLSREDANWLLLSGANFEGEGLDLDSLKSWNTQIQNARVGNPHIGHGLMLRQSYIWKGGIQYTLPEPKQGKVNVKDKINTVSNQRNFFGKSARRKRESALYSGGLYLVVGNDKTKELEPIPLEEITEIHRHPKRKSEVIAYRHTYNEFNESTGESKIVNEWIYVDHYTGPKATKMKRKGAPDEPVLQGHTAFDLHANGVDDYALGAPDALAALIWTRIVRDLTMNGVTMSNALAMFAFKASVGTKKGADNVALKMATATTPGSTATVGGVNDLVPMSSAGKGYDFDSFRFVIATAAAALHVSVIALSSDPGTAGSSYGSASTLDLPTRLAMESRRDEHIEYDSRILRWMGATDFDVYFEPYDDATELLRRLQELVIRWGSGLYGAKEMKARMEGKDESDVTVPTGVLLPNNEASLARRDIDPEGTGSGTSSTTQTTPGQGDSTGAGKTPASGDMRNDTVSKEDFSRLVNLMERWIEMDQGLTAP